MRTCELISKLDLGKHLHIIARRPPTDEDDNFELFTLWIVESPWSTQEIYLRLDRWVKFTKADK